MTRQIVWASRTVTLLSLSLLAACAPGQEGEGPRDQTQWGESVGGLACSIRPTKGVYTVGEDIPLDVLVRNEREVPLVVIAPVVHFMSFGDALPLDITGPQGAHRYEGPVLTPPAPPGRDAYRELGQGEIIGAYMVYAHPIRIVPKYWSMQQPGRYTIRLRFVRESNPYWDARQQKMVRMTAWEGTALSNPVTIQVVEPHP